MRAIRRVGFVVLVAAVLVFAVGVLPASAAVVLADSYPEANADSTWAIYSSQPEAAQSFTAVAGTLDSAVFYMSMDSGAAGEARAYLYAHSGTFGGDGLPSGAPLATSAPVGVSTIGVSNELVTFEFDNTVALTAGARYFIAVRYTGAWPYPLMMRFDATAPSHPGCMAYWTGTTWSAFVSYDAVFYVYQIPPTPLPVYRFYRASTGTHFYTADPDEMVRVRDTMGAIYHLDGVGYSINTSSPWNSVPLYRFFNRRTGTHLYTADVAEKNNILSNLEAVYSLDGVAYNVSMTHGTPVVRFFSPGQGVHFYSADPAEIDYVRNNLGAVWQYEGVAYFVMQ